MPMEKHILIIEDDDFLRDLITKNFSLEGFSVTGAPNGIEGFKKIKEAKPDLVLLDLLLPEVNGMAMDGFAVLAAIKGDAAFSQIPVILLSNLNTQEEIERGMKLGAADYFIKSQFTTEEIVSKARAILEKK